MGAYKFIGSEQITNGERRQVPITPTLRETLEAIPRVEGCPCVFTARNGERIKDPSAAAIAVLENVWKGSAKSTKKAQSEVQTGFVANSIVVTA